jgi:hypothetical protein
MSLHMWSSVPRIRTFWWGKISFLILALDDKTSNSSSDKSEHSFCVLQETFQIQNKYPLLDSITMVTYIMNTAWGISTGFKSTILFNPIIKCTIIFCSLKTVFTLLKRQSLKNIYYLHKIHIQDLRFSV